MRSPAARDAAGEPAASSTGVLGASRMLPRKSRRTSSMPSSTAASKSRASCGVVRSKTSAAAASSAADQTRTNFSCGDSARGVLLPSAGAGAWAGARPRAARP